jgi:hypothetical protein
MKAFAKKRTWDIDGRRYGTHRELQHDSIQL